ncbi:MAG: cell surface protein, partial [Bacteroidota bacterium]
TNGSSFPDYVFAPEYKLRSLEETEKYIKENSHLPEVPSAADIAKEGMSLNGMSEILLKKVEELTLHLIEMKKENEELKKRLENLEKKGK